MVQSINQLINDFYEGIKELPRQNSTAINHHQPDFCRQAAMMYCTVNSCEWFTESWDFSSILWNQLHWWM